MNLESLLVCRDADVVRVLRPTLEKLAIEVEVSAAARSGAEILSSAKFDAVIVDCDDLQGGVDVLRSLRQNASNKTSVSFAILNGKTTTQQAFEMGANFVVHKPISPERAKLTMRAAHNLMRRDRRNLNRQNLQVIATLSFEGGAEVQGIVTDLSDTGMSVLLAEPPPGGRNVRLTLPLPGTRKTIEGWGDLVWADQQGRAGIRFVQLPQVSQKELLTEWLKHFSSFRS